MSEFRVLVADKLAEPGLARLKSASCAGAGGDARAPIAFDVKTGLSPDQLAAEIPGYDALIIRSGVQVTRAVLANVGRLRAIARAGVGVDNVDVDAATAAGVLVMNTPDANTISTAEHTMAMMLALYHRIPAAHQHVAGGQWKRAEFVGHQLAGQTLGIVGFGRIGRAVAARALALDMKVIAHDPFVQGPTAMDGRVAISSDLHAVLRQADCVTLHATLSPQTRGLIGAAELALLKPTATLVNCARGELVDEVALAAALHEGRLAGAAIDVFSQEPPAGNPLLSAKNIVLTPHIGASTEEAQTAVSVEAVEAVLDYLLRGEIRGAVNLAGIPPHLSDRDKAYLDLCRRMSTLLSSLADSGIERIEVTTFGETLERVGPTLARQAVVDLLSPHLSTRLNLVNAETYARSRGIEVAHTKRSAADNYIDAIELAITGREVGAATGHHVTGDAAGGMALADRDVGVTAGRMPAVQAAARVIRHSVEGTVFIDGLPRILSIDGYRMEMVPESPMVLIFNDDRPGVIGLVGALFGRHNINIADMTLSRQAATALMLLKLDEQPPAAVLDELWTSGMGEGTPARAVPGVREGIPAPAGGPIRLVRSVTLPPVDRIRRA